MIWALMLMQAAPAPVAQYPAALAAWQACLIGAAKHYAVTSIEPAGTIAEAAFGKCVDETTALRAAMTNTRDGARMSYEQMTEIMEHISATWRARLIAQVLDLRSASHGK